MTDHAKQSIVDELIAGLGGCESLRNPGSLAAVAQHCRDGIVSFAENEDRVRRGEDAIPPLPGPRIALTLLLCWLADQYDRDELDGELVHLFADLLNRRYPPLRSV